MRYFWLLMMAIYFINIPILATAQTAKYDSLETKLADIEKKYDAKIAVFARKPSEQQLFEYQAYKLLSMQAKFNLIVNALSQPNNDQTSALRNSLSTVERAQLTTWLQHANQAESSKLAIHWIITDKNITNDNEIKDNIGIISSPKCKPIVLAIYTMQNAESAKGYADIMQIVTQTIFAELAKNELCLKASK